MHTEDKKWTDVYRQAFSDFRKRYGIAAFIAAALTAVKYFCFYSFMGITNNLIWVWGLSLVFVFLFFCAFRRKWIPAVLCLLASILMFADVLYHGYYNAYLTVRIINSAKMIGDITASIEELIKPQYFILFADNIAVFVTLILSALKRRKETDDTYCSLKEERSYDLPKALKVFLASALTLFMIFNPIGSDFVASVSAQEFMTYHVRDLTSISEGGNGEKPYYIATGTYENTLPEEGSEDDPEAEDIVKLYGAAEGRNLIVIQLEAFQDFAVNMEYEGQELTPFLNSLVNEGETVYFDNYYYQVGSGNTSDAEFATNNSIFGTMSSYTYTLYTDNYFRGLPVLMKDRGYETAAMHAYDKTFWNRSNMYPAQGFDHFFDSDYYEDDEDYNGWTVVATNDENFYLQSVDAMETMTQPFYSFMVTLSGHHPFQQSKENCLLKLKNPVKGTIVGDYFNTVRYVDKALESFFEELKERGLYENSIICLYGDHYGLSCTDPEIKEIMSEVTGKDYNYESHFNVPLIINIPGSGVNMKVSTAGGQLDFLPTVAYLMGFEELDTIYLGQNLITADSGFAAIQQFLNKGSFINDDILFRSSGDEVYSNSSARDLKTGTAASIEGFENESARSVQYAELSEFYLQYDVLDKVLNKGMSIDEILSGMDSKGKPVRIAMPLSSLKDTDVAGEDGSETAGNDPAASAADPASEEELQLTALEKMEKCYSEGYRYMQVNAADDKRMKRILRAKLEDENGVPYSESTLVGVSDVCAFLTAHPDVSVIIRPVAEEGEVKYEAEEGSAIEMISDNITKLAETFYNAAEEAEIDIERCIWNSADMDHYKAAEKTGFKNGVIQPDMSAYDIYKWNNFFMSYHPWAVFLPENISALYMNDLSASSSEMYLVQDGRYDEAHEERMDLTGAYGEVTYDQEPIGQTEKEIMELKAETDDEEEESVNLVSEALRYISNGRHPGVGMSVVCGFSALAALIVFADRKIRRNRMTRKIQG